MFSTCILILQALTLAAGYETLGYSPTLRTVRNSDSESELSGFKGEENSPFLLKKYSSFNPPEAYVYVTNSDPKPSAMDCAECLRPLLEISVLLNPCGCLPCSLKVTGEDFSYSQKLLAYFRNFDCGTRNDVRAKSSRLMHPVDDDDYRLRGAIPPLVPAAKHPDKASSAQPTSQNSHTTGKKMKPNENFTPTNEFLSDGREEMVIPHSGTKNGTMIPTGRRIFQENLRRNGPRLSQFRRQINGLTPKNRFDDFQRNLRKTDSTEEEPSSRKDRNGGMTSSILKKRPNFDNKELFEGVLKKTEAGNQPGEILRQYVERPVERGDDVMSRRRSEWHTRRPEIHQKYTPRGFNMYENPYARPKYRFNTGRSEISFVGTGRSPTGVPEIVRTLSQIAPSVRNQFPLRVGFKNNKMVAKPITDLYSDNEDVPIGGNDGNPLESSNRKQTRPEESMNSKELDKSDEKEDSVPNSKESTEQEENPTKKERLNDENESEEETVPSQEISKDSIVQEKDQREYSENRPEEEKGLNETRSKENYGSEGEQNPENTDGRDIGKPEEEVQSGRNSGEEEMDDNKASAEKCSNDQDSNGGKERASANTPPLDNKSGEAQKTIGLEKDPLKDDSEVRSTVPHISSSSTETSLITTEDIKKSNDRNKAGSTNDTMTQKRDEDPSKTKEIPDEGSEKKFKNDLSQEPGTEDIREKDALKTAAEDSGKSPWARTVRRRKHSNISFRSGEIEEPETGSNAENITEKAQNEREKEEKLGSSEQETRAEAPGTAETRNTTQNAVGSDDQSEESSVEGEGVKEKSEDENNGSGKLERNSEMTHANGSEHVDESGQTKNTSSSSETPSSSIRSKEEESFIKKKSDKNTPTDMTTESHDSVQPKSNTTTALEEDPTSLTHGEINKGVVKRSSTSVTEPITESMKSVDGRNGKGVKENQEAKTKNNTAKANENNEPRDRRRHESSGNVSKTDNDTDEDQSPATRSFPREGNVDRRNVNETPGKGVTWILNRPENKMDSTGAAGKNPSAELKSGSPNNTDDKPEVEQDGNKKKNDGDQIYFKINTDGKGLTHTVSIGTTADNEKDDKDNCKKDRGVSTTIHLDSKDPDKMPSVKVNVKVQKNEPTDVYQLLSHMLQQPGKSYMYHPETYTYRGFDAYPGRKVAYSRTPLRYNGNKHGYGSKPLRKDTSRRYGGVRDHYDYI